MQPLHRHPGVVTPRAGLPGDTAVDCGRLAPGHGLTAVELHAAAQAFHDKGATPREMRSALGLTMLEHGTLTAKVVERAARDVAVASDRHSAEYADLWAVKASSSKAFLSMV
ncbi:MAG: hypothetical protein IPF98_22600 [Gemmatimonadetes bacterium]|nr:hypothetical protein [Gemmatimonadota bacterium]